MPADPFTLTMLTSGNNELLLEFIEKADVILGFHQGTSK